MSTICLLFSICLIATLVSYTTWVNVDIFLKREVIKESKEITILQQYDAYLTRFNKKYEESEYSKRIEYFKKSLEEISRLNNLQPGNVYGLNKLSDMSEQEFRRKMLSPVIRACKPLQRDRCPPLIKIRGLHKRNRTALRKTDNLPLRFDWRKQGVVSEVLNQKLCYGCWAMSIVGVMESMAAIETGKLYPLSSQELIDCSTYTTGCNRGDVREALNFLCMHDFPIVHEHDYPLKLVNEQCRIPEHNRPRGLRIKTFTNECNMDEDLMLRVVAYHGPIVAVVNARGWLYYNNGVIQRACASDWGYMNHVVQIVGYDLTADVPYYIVRNSWGDDFGENGYLKLAIHGNVCGVANNVAYFDVVYK